MSKCECTATISESDPRFEIWRQVNPKAEIPLKHPLPVRNKAFPNLLFYEGDPTRLTNEQKHLIAKLLHEKFSLSEQDVLDDLFNGVLPIRSDNVTAFICNLHLRCMI